MSKQILRRPHLKLCMNVESLDKARVKATFADETTQVQSIHISGHYDSNFPYERKEI